MKPIFRKMAFVTSAFCILTIPTTAMPVRNARTATVRDSAASNANIQVLLTIAQSSTTCSGALYPEECATADQAADPLLASFEKYNITTGPEQAALLSLQAYESAEFKYNHNHFPAPGTLGKGCRNMLSPTFVAQFAATLPDVQAQLKGSTDPETVLDATIAAGHEWDAAAWFYSSQCSQSIKQGVQAGTQSGWEAFITTCVGTIWDEGSGTTSRLAYWTSAMHALGWTNV